MSVSPTQPLLRLVRDDDAPRGLAVERSPARPGEAVSSAVRMQSPRERAERSVAQENAAAASLSALDPRWVLAVQVSREIQGGRAAVLTPEGRRRLLLVGNRLGLRQFDTNLVIAIVQDGARAGEDPLGTNAVGRLRLVACEPELSDARTGPGWGLVVAMVIAAGIFGSGVTLAILRLLG